MNAPLTPLVELTERLLKVSVQAALLIVLVLLVKAVVGRRLPPRVSYALWLIVVARLLLPVSLESGFSIFNLSTSTPAKVFRAGGEGSSASAVNAEAKRASAPETTSGSPTVPTPTARTAAEKVEASSAKVPASGSVASTKAGQPTWPAVSAGKPFSWPQVLALIWLAGVVLLLARIIWIPLRLNAALAQHETATPPAIFEILEESKRLSGVNQVLPIVQSRAVESPALLGFVRPWLLLPEGLVGKFTPQELRLVFLHELAHLKRRDIAVNWLATLLQILHWPNPLVWIAFARMRADREVACDELALSFAREGEGPAYGHAIIKLLEGFRRPTALPGLVGILEDQQHMQRRIIMIAQFKQMTGWSASAAGLVLALGLVTLTDAQTEKNPAKPMTPMRTASVRTVYSGLTGIGTLSPDESAIVFVNIDEPFIDFRFGKNHLQLLDPLTGKSLPMVDDPEPHHVWGPVWSADSRFVAYGAFDRGATLRIIPRSGGPSRTVATQDRFLNIADWSRDGKYFVGVTGPDLKLMNVASGEVRVLGPAGHQPRFSPDGRFVAIERMENGNRDIFVTTLDGQTTRITDSPAEDSAPVFSADGKWILFSSNRRGAWDLWAIGFDRGRPVGSAWPVKYDFGDHPKWITATGKLAFFAGRSMVDVYQVAATRSPSHEELTPRGITKSAFGRNSFASWSPDGNTIAYRQSGGVSAYTQAGGVVCLLSIKDGVERTFDPQLAYFTEMLWSPDGRTIALCGRGRDRSLGLFLFSVADPKQLPIQILNETTATGAPIGFTSDGKEVMFWVKDGRVALNIATGVKRDIPTPAELRGHNRFTFTYALPDLSADGSFAAYVTKQGKQYELASLELNHETRRVVARAQAQIVYPRWSPDRSKLAYYERIANGAKPEHRLHICAADGSWDRIVDTGDKHIPGEPHAPNWSADSTRLVIDLGEARASEIGLLENFLPVEKAATK